MGCSSSKANPPDTEENASPRSIDPPQQSPTQSIPKPRPPSTRGPVSGHQRPLSSYDIARRHSRTSHRDAERLSRTAYGDSGVLRRTSYGDGERHPRTSHGDGGRHPRTSHGDGRRHSRHHDLGASSSGVPATAHGWPAQASSRHPIPQRIPIGLSAQFTEDGAIVGRASYLNNRIFQHAEYYYHRDASAGQPQTPELHDRRSRHAAIREELARRIIESVTLSQVPRSDAEIMAFSSQASGYLAPYAQPSTGGAREDHLLTLFRIGAELQELISSHPSDWGFDGWNSAGGFVIGFIVVFPALLKDGQEVMRRETIRVRLS